MSDKDFKSKYFHANIGDFQNSFQFMGFDYEKIEDLRYGTNPHQKGAIYRPKQGILSLGAYETIKSGKGGLSQTNVEDINYAVKILKYYISKACVIMKHLNPCGASVSLKNDSLKDVYINARDADPQAAFGGVVGFNHEVDEQTADEIMQSVIEVVIAPSYTAKAISIFNDSSRYKRNKHIRILKIPDMNKIPKFIGDETPVKEVKVLMDGTIILADPYLTRIKSPSDLIMATSAHPDKGEIKCIKMPSERELDDLVFSWYVNLSVRSNGVVIAKNGTTLAVGTGQQDRVGAVVQAIDKVKSKYKGNESLEGAVLSSDGFFPFRDSIDFIAKEGIKAIVQPGGSVSDYEVIQACNEHSIAMVFTDERCFSHH